MPGDFFVFFLCTGEFICGYLSFFHDFFETGNLLATFRQKKNARELILKVDLIIA